MLIPRCFQSLIFLSCFPVFLGAQTFEDISEEAGIDFLYQEVGSMGGGVAFLDYNGDGL